MRRVELGASGMAIPVVGQGTMGFGGYFSRETENDAAHVAAIRNAVECGMSLIDTAEIYGAGHAEELVGIALRGIRDKAFVATKFSPEHSSAGEVRAAAERSLRRLQTDHIDLYQTHWPNPKVPFDETLDALGELIAEGKVRLVGLCNTSPRQIEAAAARLGADKFVSVQQQYNVVDRDVEREILPLTAVKGLCLLAYSPLLEGKLAPADARRQTLASVAEKNGITMGQVILLWLLRKPNVVVIPKAARRENLAANAACGSMTLPDEDLARISAAYETQVVDVDPALIDLTPQPGRVLYQDEAEARANPAGMTPSPAELAREILGGDSFRPIKVRKTSGGARPYRLIEGGLRFWAWRIAYGARPVPANVEVSAEV